MDFLDSFIGSSELWVRCALVPNMLVGFLAFVLVCGSTFMLVVVGGCCICCVQKRKGCCSFGYTLVRCLNADGSETKMPRDDFNGCYHGDTSVFEESTCRRNVYAIVKSTAVLAVAGLVVFATSFMTLCVCALICRVVQRCSEGMKQQTLRRIVQVTTILVCNAIATITTVGSLFVTAKWWDHQYRRQEDEKSVDVLSDGFMAVSFVVALILATLIAMYVFAWIGTRTCFWTHPVKAKPVTELASVLGDDDSIPVRVRIWNEGDVESDVEDGKVSAHDWTSVAPTQPPPQPMGSQEMMVLPLPPKFEFDDVTNPLEGAVMSIVSHAVPLHSAPGGAPGGGPPGGAPVEVTTHAIQNVQGAKRLMFSWDDSK